MEQPVKSRGSALIVVLWVVGLLSVLVASLAFEAHIEARITAYYRNRSRADYLLRSGIDVSQILLERSKTVKKQTDASATDEDDRWFDAARQLSEGLAVTVNETLDQAVLTVELVPEPARRNVNRLKEDDWTRILDVAGIPAEQWGALIDSFFDWTDRDETPRVEGAETDDYYATLEPPYRARNGPLDTVGELTLVKGFTPTILSGGTLVSGIGEEDAIVISGIEDMLTTYGDGKVNVNAASRRVLMTLPDIDALVADLILEERRSFVDEQGTEQDASFESVGDFMGRIPGLSAQVQRAITTRSTIFRMRVTATVNGVTRQAWGIILDGGDAPRILQWREHE
jgi:general secretion pathway protein K